MCGWPESRHAAEGCHTHRDRERPRKSLRQPNRTDRQQRAGYNGQLDRTFETQGRNQHEAAQQRTQDGAQGVPGINAGCRRGCVFGALGKNSHGQGKGAPLKNAIGTMTAATPSVLPGSRRSVDTSRGRDSARNFRHHESCDGRTSIAGECRADCGPECEPCQEAGKQGPECLQTAAQQMTQQAGPEYFVEQRHAPGQQHQREDPGRRRGRVKDARPAAAQAAENPDRRRSPVCDTSEPERPRETLTAAADQTVRSILQSATANRLPSKHPPRHDRIRGKQQTDTASGLTVILDQRVSSAG